MLQVADHEYDISCARLELFDREGEDIICWGVSIIGKSQGGSDDMDDWDPAIIAEVLMETKPGQMSHWYELGGTTIAWEEPNEDPQALFEVFETHAIYDCEWQFVGTPNGAGVGLLFEGTVDVDDDHEGLLIKLETNLEIAPWPMGDWSEQECLDRYRQLGFKDPVKFQLIDGVSHLVFLNQ